MKIFITGSNGFLGSAFINKVSAEHEIVTFDLENNQSILDYEQIKSSMKGCDSVVHLAAIKGPDETKSFEDYFQLNDNGTLNVARACLENNVKKLIYASSTGYYGVEIGIPYQTPIKETNLTVAQNVQVDALRCRDCDIAYSTSKVIAEQILANYGLRKKFQVIMLRFGPIGDKSGAKWNLDGITLQIENAVQAIEKALNVQNELWYEAFTITDTVDNVDISKAEKLLDYNPI
ncbi:NAD(P)-dependent oxidoreductase [Candidatus Roizmanbacteria bacterium]|nr:NAD(P)-dependent oxidoreductase [Candidatus Roizmanbacteria bacterium]